MQISPISNRSLTQLADDIISYSIRLNASEYEFLVLVREFDIRQGWKEGHFNNCAEWLNFKCGISISTGREKVRVALGLFDLPLCSQAFSEGKLSYSKARSITRVATRLNEGELLDFAFTATASQVDEHCIQLRNAQRHVSTGDANKAFRSRCLSRSNHPDGTMTITVDLPKEMGDLVMKAIEIAGEAIERDSGHAAEDRQDDFFRKQADALVQVAKGYLTGGSTNKTSTADHYQVMVHVDECALVYDRDGREQQGREEEAAESQKEGTGKSDLPIESVRRITCDASIVPVSEDKKGNPLNVGRKQRVVSPPLKRALLSRDKCCAFPGCSHDRWLDSHHVRHWADGGETNLSNLVLLCSHHHRLLHEGGYTIKKNFEGDWYFRNANGKVIPNSPVVDLDEGGDPPRGGLVGERSEYSIREPAPVYAVA